MQQAQIQKTVQVNDQYYTYFSLEKFAQIYAVNLQILPFSIRILLENLLRHYDGDIVKLEDILALAKWEKNQTKPREIAYYPARVLMQDFTGVPCIVDLAALRDAMHDLGKDPAIVNPSVPVDLVIDHSVQVDYFGFEGALEKNLEMEYKRNAERYTLLKWSQKAFDNIRVFPPGAGIVHQVNLEYIATVAATKEADNQHFVYPDTLVGTDSHTTMINALGVMGWGVGGIEAEAVMLGQPYFMKVPEVIGVHLRGSLREGITTTDLVLTITELLRGENVVEKFVEFFGEGLKSLSLPDRATLANMSPEYGATMGFFPVDDETIRYLRLTNRDKEAALAQAYMQVQGLFYDGEDAPLYTKVLEVDLASVTASIAGPSRPQDRIDLDKVQARFQDLLHCNYGRQTAAKELGDFDNESQVVAGAYHDSCAVRTNTRNCSIQIDGKTMDIGDGSIVIAAITSCTNTSNPSVMIGAGLVAKKAVERGLMISDFVKTSFAPGSKVVAGYLEKAGLIPFLQKLRFNIVGYGCTTCIGNSGPLHPEIEKAIKEEELAVSAVLSGNRNFEARIHPLVKTNFLASPILVVAYALAGNMQIDLTKEPLGFDSENQAVYLKDIWPSAEEISAVIADVLHADMFAQKYTDIFEGEKQWQALPVPDGLLFDWDTQSTYIRRPPFFEGFSMVEQPRGNISDARVLLALGDSVTTDHISPAGKIEVDYPAGQYLLEHDVTPLSFNSYGSRRGNHEVMIRGTFANVRIKNLLVAPKEGGYTLHFPEKKETFVFDAARMYADTNTPLIVLAGKEYGTGSSRDWAAKGTQLLGVKAVIARSYERIHRSNLIGMGVLPLQFQNGENWQTLGLDGSEVIMIEGIKEMQVMQTLTVNAYSDNGTCRSFKVTSRLDTPVDLAYFRAGGILPFVLRSMAKESSEANKN